MTFKDFMAACEKSVEEIGALFTKPQDDWDPVAYFASGDEIRLAIIDWEFMRTPETKAQLGDVVLPHYAREFNADKYALVTSSWMVEPEAAERDAMADDYDGPPPSQHPDRFEGVSIVACDREIATAAYARIIRHDDKPPTLSDWTELGMTDGQVTGRMVDSVREVMR